MTLDVYNVTYTGGAPTAVTLSQSIPLPTATSGTPPTSGNRYLTQSGINATEGGLTLSLDGRYMALAGYNNIVGGVTTGTGNSGQRVVGLLDLSTGTVDTTTDYADTSTSNTIANAFTTDGTDIWTANSSGGIRYVTAGGSTSTALTGTSNERRVYVYPTASGNQIYASRSSSPIFGVETVGGAPAATSGTQSETSLPGMPTSNSASPYDFFFADANTLYIGDSSNNTSGTIRGGLEKWIYNGSSWTLAYNLLVNPTGTSTRGLRSLTGMVDASGNVTLFGATTDTAGGPNYLYGFADTLTNTSAANVIANELVDASTMTGGTGERWNLRGVALAIPVPEPATLLLLLLGLVASSAITRRAR
ncbi:MAG TPA: PEP-CTERM sorting domain-containing protein [Lacipirellulaceae bacterium]|nr:PEP-CTERM sorting domain-containing protein [Lacipirellulaceae bacterium]